MSANRECVDSQGNPPCITRKKEGCPFYKSRDCFGPPSISEKLRDAVWDAVIKAGDWFYQQVKGAVNLDNLLLAEAIVSATALTIGAISNNILLFSGGFGGAALYNVADLSRRSFSCFNEKD